MPYCLLAIRRFRLKFHSLLCHKKCNASYKAPRFKYVHSFRVNISATTKTKKDEGIKAWYIEK